MNTTRRKFLALLGIAPVAVVAVAEAVKQPRDDGVELFSMAHPKTGNLPPGYKVGANLTATEQWYLEEKEGMTYDDAEGRTHYSYGSIDPRGIFDCSQDA